MYNRNPVNKILGNGMTYKPLQPLKRFKSLKKIDVSKNNIALTYVIEVSDHWNQPVKSDEWTTTLSPKEWLKQIRKDSDSYIPYGRWTTPYTYDTGETVLGFGPTKEIALKRAEARWYRGLGK